MANGFSYAASHEWANLGQGAPEVGDIPDAPARPQSITLPLDSLEYAPTTGVKDLREAVANLYNHTYRQGKLSQYTYENVCIVPGGRAGLSRVAAVIGDVYCVRATVRAPHRGSNTRAVVPNPGLYRVRSDARRVQAACARADRA